MKKKSNRSSCMHDGEQCWLQGYETKHKEDWMWTIVENQKDKLYKIIKTKYLHFGEEKLFNPSIKLYKTMNENKY